MSAPSLLAPKDTATAAANSTVDATPAAPRGDVAGGGGDMSSAEERGRGDRQEPH